MKVADSAREVRLVVQPHQSVYAGRSAPLRFEECQQPVASDSHRLLIAGLRRTAKDSLRYPGKEDVDSMCQRLPRVGAAAGATQPGDMGTRYTGLRRVLRRLSQPD
jgi:hypothetical protein